MDKIITTLQIKDQDGNNILTAPDIAGLEPTLNNKSVVSEVFPPYPQLLSTRYQNRVPKKMKRTQSKLVVNTAKYPALSTFVQPSAEQLGIKFMDRTVRTDNILFNQYDRLAVDTQNRLLAHETADFLLTAHELDLNEMLTQAVNDAQTIKLYSAIDTANGSIPTGTQPADVAAGQTTDLTVADIVKGKRVTSKITDLDAKADNRINLIRAALTYLNRLGAPTGAETFYPFSINGIPLGDLFILTNYENAVKIQSSFTTTVVNLDKPGDFRNLNGIVAYIDTVRVIITNQLPTLIGSTAAKVPYIIMSNRVGHRNMANSDDIDYIGTITTNPGVVIPRGSTTPVQTSPADGLLAFESPRSMGIIYPEEIIALVEA